MAKIELEEASRELLRASAGLVLVGEATEGGDRVDRSWSYRRWSLPVGNWHLLSTSTFPASTASTPATMALSNWQWVQWGMPRRMPSTRRGTKLPSSVSKAVTKVVPPPMGPASPPEGPPPSQGEPSKVAVIKGEILQLEGAANADRVLARAQVGKKLLEVKVELKHGEWLFWLNDNVPFTASTAKRAIQLWHLSQNDPALFEALRPLGLTKAYKLMTMAPAEVEAFLSQAHPVPGAGIKTPHEMNFGQMMSVLHPPKPETKLLITTKLVKSIRRQTIGLGRLIGELWKMVPSVSSKKQPVKEALSVLAYELDEVADALEDKSLIEGNIPSFG